MCDFSSAFACARSLRVLDRVRAFVERAYNSRERADLLYAERLGAVSHFVPVMSRGGDIRILTGKVLPVLIGGVIKVITPEPAKIPAGREWLCKPYLVLRGASPQSEHPG